MSQAAEIEITSAPSSDGTITVDVNGTSYSLEVSSSDNISDVAAKIVDRMDDVSGFTESQEYNEFVYIWGDTKVTSISFSDTDSTGVTANTQLLTFFTWRGDEEFSKEIEWGTLVTPFENGPEQRRNKQPKRRVFKLPFTQFQSDAQDIRDFFNARQGRYDDFYWQNPDTGEVINVRFASDNLSRSRIYDVAESFSITLREIL